MSAEAEQMSLAAERLHARTANRRWIEKFHDRVFEQLKGCDYVVITEAPPNTLHFFQSLPDVEAFIRNAGEREREVAVYRYRGASDAILML